jgi:hypothetical protein
MLELAAASTNAPPRVAIAVCPPTATLAVPGEWLTWLRVLLTTLQHVSTSIPDDTRVLLLLLPDFVLHHTFSARQLPWRLRPVTVCQGDGVP